MQDNVVLKTRFIDLKLINRGKVRDLYDLGDSLLIVSTDRISAFDVVMAEGIPAKGKVLTRLTEFWLSHISDIVPNHLISTDVDDFPPECKKHAGILAGRSMLVTKAEPVAAECIVRGYISGSGWKDYQKTGAICGIPLPSGLTESSPLAEPIFTPSTKAEAGTHDENISFEQVCDIVGQEIAEKLRDLTLSIYQRAKEIAETRGIIIADTKLEFGISDGKIILIDEVLTPDSSRFWPMDSYEAGRPQMSFDKQFVRDYLSLLGWDKNPPPPPLPADIIQKTSEKYIEAYKRLTGESFPEK
jgi:phosphoribosylaminoimidazole-succinocarboxamide synthase